MGDGDGAREEFDDLYREPLLRFIRRSGWPEDCAEDLLQSYLVKLAETLLEGEEISAEMRYLAEVLAG